MFFIVLFRLNTEKLHFISVETDVALLKKKLENTDEMLRRKCTLSVQMENPETEWAEVWAVGMHLPRAPHIVCVCQGPETECRSGLPRFRASPWSSSCHRGGDGPSGAVPLPLGHSHAAGHRVLPCSTVAVKAGVRSFTPMYL